MLRSRRLIALFGLAASVALASEPCEVAKLTNPDDPPGDVFCGGAIEPDVVVTRDGRADGLLGALYVFRRRALSWRFEAKLTAPEPVDDDSYGRSVAMSDDVIVVGAPRRHAPKADQGAAYAYSWQGGAWTFEAELVASNAEEGDQFGASVDIFGETLVVGAVDATRGGQREAGAAYVFVRDGGSWRQSAELLHPEPEEGASLGFAVSIDGDLAAVAVPRDDSGRGSVLVFRRVGVAWTFEAKLQPNDARKSTRFGDSVSLASGVLIGGSWDSNEGGPNAGAAYVFRRNDGIWHEETKLLASDAAPNDFFGDDVALTPSGTVALVGAPGDDPRGSESGSVYVFRFTDGQWKEDAKIIGSCSGPQLGIGGCLDADEDLAVLGQPGQPSSRGTVYVIAGLSGSDCNGNAQADSCEVYAKKTEDRDGNGISDECDRADIDRDGDVDIADLLMMLAHWGACEVPCKECNADLDRDCDVGTADLLILLLNWTEGYAR